MNSVSPCVLVDLLLLTILCHYQVPKHLLAMCPEKFILWADWKSFRLCWKTHCPMPRHINRIGLQMKSFSDYLLKLSLKHEDSLVIAIVLQYEITMKWVFTGEREGGRHRKWPDGNVFNWVKIEECIWTVDTIFHLLLLRRGFLYILTSISSNKLASLEATQVQNYHPLIYSQGWGVELLA